MADPTYVDIAGQPIEVGSLLCYAALWIRSATLRHGRVTGLKVRAGREYGPVDEQEDKATLRVFAVDRRREVTRVNNVVTVTTHWEVINNGKPITLGFLDRLLVVPESVVPAEALALLQV